MAVTCTGYIDRITFHNPDNGYTVARLKVEDEREPVTLVGAMPLVAEGDRYAFVRAHLGDAVLAVWNRGDNPTEFSLAAGPEMVDGTYVDALSGQEIEVKDGQTSFKLDPMKSALFVAKES